MKKITNKILGLVIGVSIFIFAGGEKLYAINECDGSRIGLCAETPGFPCDFICIYVSGWTCTNGGRECSPE